MVELTLNYVENFKEHIWILNILNIFYVFDIIHTSWTKLSRYSNKRHIVKYLSRNAENSLEGIVYLLNCEHSGTKWGYIVSGRVIPHSFKSVAFFVDVESRVIVKFSWFGLGKVSYSRCSDNGFFHFTSGKIFQTIQ